MAPKKTGVGGRTVPGFEPADDDDSPQPSSGRRRNRKKNKNKNKEQEQEGKEGQEGRSGQEGQGQRAQGPGGQGQCQGQGQGQHYGEGSTFPMASGSNTQQKLTIRTHDISTGNDNSADNDDTTSKDPGSEENSKNERAPFGSSSKQTDHARDAGKISRQCQEKDSHRNKKAQTEMSPQQNTNTSNSIETEPHIETNFLNPGKQAQIKKSRFAHPDKEFDHHELRTTIVPAHKDLKIITNHFKVDLPAGTVLYEYLIKGLPAKATRAKCKMMILDMIEIDPELYNARNQIATDYKTKLITLTPLKDTVQTPGVILRLIDVNDFKAGSRETPAVKSLELSFHVSHDLDGLKAYTKGENEHYEDRGAKEALNIVIAKAVADANIDDITFQLGNNRFYFRPGWNDLQPDPTKVRDTDSIGLVAIRGYHSTIKPGMGNVLLNVNNVTSAFYKAQPLQDYLQHFRHLQRWDNAAEGIPDRAKRELEQHLGGLRVRINFKRAGVDGQPDEIDWEGRRVKTLSEFGKFPHKQTFKLDERYPNKLVWKHLKGKYTASCPEEDKTMPAANVGRKEAGKQKYYLASQLDVIAGQIYKGTLSGDDTAAMISIAKKRPEETYKAILSEGLRCLGLRQGSSLPMLRALNITVIPKLLELPARRIVSPRILYNPGAPTPRDGTWQMPPGSKFKTGSSGSIKTVQFFCGDWLPERDHDCLQVYIEAFMRNHGTYGAQKVVLRDSGHRYEIVRDWSPEKLQRQLKALRDCARFDIAVIIFPSADRVRRSNYTNFKIAADQLCGVKSLCICTQKLLPKTLLEEFDEDTSSAAQRILNRGLDHRKIKDYIRNLSMKLNLRFGNITHTIESGQLDLLNKRDVVIMGADVTHPGAGDINGTPSIAAVVGTVDNQFSLYNGHMRLNPPRQEIIQQIEEMALDLIREWFKKNKDRMPKEILFYRDGVSESQYAEVREREVSAIRSAWKKIKESDGDWDGTAPVMPKITAIVVTKRHHTRIYPSPTPKTQQQLKGKSPIIEDVTKSGNCIPGTIVDHTITSPYYFDFYLLSHNVPGYNGTAKPAHYIVLENGMDFSAQEIQDLTFHLCFTYARCNCSVSYVPPAYYADRLCERGRLYLKPFQDLCQEQRPKYAKMQEDRPDAFWRECEKVFYRGGGRDLADGAAANPWHKDLDGTMFWM